MKDLTWHLLVNKEPSAKRVVVYDPKEEIITGAEYQKHPNNGKWGFVLDSGGWRFPESSIAWAEIQRPSIEVMNTFWEGITITE